MMPLLVYFEQMSRCRFGAACLFIFRKCRNVTLVIIIIKMQDHLIANPFQRFVIHPMPRLELVLIVYKRRMYTIDR